MNIGSKPCHHEQRCSAGLLYDIPLLETGHVLLISKRNPLLKVSWHVISKCSHSSLPCFPMPFTACLVSSTHIISHSACLTLRCYRHYVYSPRPVAGRRLAPLPGRFQDLRRDPGVPVMFCTCTTVFRKNGHSQYWQTTTSNAIWYLRSSRLWW